MITVTSLRSLSRDNCYMYVTRYMLVHACIYMYITWLMFNLYMALLMRASICILPNPLG